MVTEDIAYNRQRRRFYLLIEAESTDGTSRRSSMSATSRQVRSAPRVDLRSTGGNPDSRGCALRAGEGLSPRLVQGKQCRGGGADVKNPGGRRAHPRSATQREGLGTVARIKLRGARTFDRLFRGRAARRSDRVVSQQDSHCGSAGCTHELDGRSRRPDVRFPGRARASATIARRGLAWMSANRFVAVRISRSGGNPGRCKRTDESIHVFRLP